MENKRLFLSIEQTRSLQEQAVDMLNAAYWFVRLEDNSEYEILPAKSYMVVLFKSSEFKTQYCPTFSFQECLSALPKEIIIDGKSCFLSIDYWKCAFEYNLIDEEENTSSTVAQEQFSEDNMIDAVFNFLLMTATMINSGKWHLPKTEKDE